MSKIPELPRFLHKPGGASLKVTTEDEYVTAMDGGWSVSNQFPEDATAESVAEAPDDVPPPKRARKK